MYRLRGSEMAITEFLTQHRLTILNKTQNTFGFCNAWSLKGRRVYTCVL